MSQLHLVLLLLSSLVSAGCTSRSSLCSSDGVKGAKESTLRQNLFTLRSLIQQYTLDKQKAPQSLDDLVAAGYLKQIPQDPTTGTANWVVDQEADTVKQQERGISDVHSASSATSCQGALYSSW